MKGKADPSGVLQLAESSLIFGAVLGFLMQKGGATRYDKIVGQPLLSDFTVVKIMLSAVESRMIGINTMSNNSAGQDP